MFFSVLANLRSSNVLFQYFPVEPYLWLYKFKGHVSFESHFNHACWSANHICHSVNVNIFNYVKVKKKDYHK